MARVSRIFLFFLFFVDFSATLVSAPKQTFYSSIAAGDFSLFQENGKVGLKNKEGQVLIPAQYEAMGWSNGEFSVVDNVTGYQLKGLWGLINLQNNKVTPAQFTDLSPGEGSVIAARKKIQGSVKIQSGCIATSGKEVIPFQYDGLRITSLRAIVYTRSGNQFRHGLIDLENRQLIPLQYQSIYPLGSLRYAVQNTENKTAIFADDGKQITGFEIDSISTFRKDYAVLYQNQRQGLINRQGEIRLEPTYREISLGDDGTIRARQSDAWLFLDGENKLLRQVNADSVSGITPERFIIRLNNRSWIADRDLNRISPEAFSSLGKFRNGRSVFRQGPRAGIVDVNGKIILAASYADLYQERGLIRARSFNGPAAWSILDSTGRPLMSKRYEYLGPFNGAYFPAKHRGYWGAVDSQGKEIVACVHDSLVQYRDPYVQVKFKGNYGVIDLHEDWIVVPQPARLQLIGNDRYLVRSGKTSFLRSMKGEVIYFSDNTLDPFDDFLLEHLPSGELWKIDLNGVIAERNVHPALAEKKIQESEGLRVIWRDGAYGFVDSRGRLRIANRYEDAREFHEQLAPVKIRGKWGFISHAEQIVVQPNYDDVTAFAGGFSIVKQKDLFGMIDKNGKLVLPVRYDEILALPSGKFQVKQNGFWGLADSSGRMIVNPKFDTLTDLGNNYVIVGRNGKFGLLTSQGLSTIPEIYDGLTFDAAHNQFIALKKMEWEPIQLTVDSRQLTK
jgi:hypothetical protein